MTIAGHPRTRRRAEPRFAITLAGAGTALAVLGAVTVGGDQLGTSDADPFGGGGNRAVGVLLSAAVVVVGYLFVSRFRDGPLASSGVVASALGLPALVFFVAFSSSNPFDGGTLDAILGVSSLVWAVSYLAGPGRARLFYLGAALAGVWLFALRQVGPSFGAESLFGIGDTNDIGLLSLLLGAGYMAAVRVLDDRGHHGSATPFAAVGLVALATGVVALARDLHATGTGVLLFVLGVALAALGAAAQRRFTTWIGGAAALIGVTVIVGDRLGDGVSATTAGVVFLVTGAGIVAISYLVSERWPEPPDTDPVPSFRKLSANENPPPATE